MIIEEFGTIFRAIEEEISRLIVGQQEVVRKILVAFFAGGHILLEGVPGLGKTLIVHSVSRALALSFKRIQFTPDLMPTDIIGMQLLDEQDPSGFRFRRGPIFANVVLADEINRATPKTQSALLEAMEEHQVTTFGETHRLDEPFFVLATQNPIELEGTYPLPEAQLDRFLFKLLVEPPDANNLKEILRRTTVAGRPEVGRVLEPKNAPEIVTHMRRLVREVILAPPFEDYIVSVIIAATPQHETAHPSVRSYLRYGPGPRAAQAIVLGAKVNALLDERGHVSFEDVADVLAPALRHRMVMSFQAEAENVTTDQILDDIIRGLPRP
jgi:MoxR-like ATPase